MKEHIDVRQIPGDRRRRWFSSADFDLIVWFEPPGDIFGFELCYDKTRLERSIVWRARAGFAHMVVDDGEQRPGKHKASPILVPDGHFDANRVHSAFARESASLPEDIASYVLQTLARHPSYGPPR